MPSSSIRVVVADDCDAFRSGIVTLLSPHRTSAWSGKRRRPIGTEVAAAGGRGTFRCPHARSHHTRSPRSCARQGSGVGDSAFGLDDYVLDAIAAGADGYP